MSASSSELRRRRRVLLSRLKWITRALRDWDARGVGQIPLVRRSPGPPPLTRDALQALHAELSLELCELERLLDAGLRAPRQR